jgi:putative membrane protein
MLHFYVPLLHAGVKGYPEGFLHSSWRFDPTVVIGVAGLVGAYVLLTGPLNRRRPGVADRPVTRGQAAAFIGGCLVLLFALGQPLDDWSDHYFLSAHMLQHLLLMLLVPPLWLLGLPSWILEPLTTRPWINRIGYALTRPAVAFAIASVTLVLWHLPSLYDAALRHQPIHILEHQMFLATSILVWWPIVGPLPAWPRLSKPLQCVYLFLLTLPSGIVGAFITLGSTGIYSAYDHAPRLWGMSLQTDQVVAGLLMWVLGNLIYLGLITVVFFQWSSESDREERDSGGLPAPTAPVSTATHP